jgi:ADP-heptose:LPS heptosyltransferase
MSASSRRQPLPDDPRSILATALCPIGDTLFLTPALALLRRRFPQARITVAAAAANRGALAGNPDVDELLIVQDPAAGFHPWRLLAGARTLGRLRPDVVINFSAGGAIVARLAGLRAPRLGLQ